MTIAICYIVYNDLPMLRCTLPYEQRWADQIVVLDLGSTDGTKEFCARFLRPSDIYQRREVNTVPELGFSEARNACAKLATTQWIGSWAANVVLKWGEATALRKLLGSTRAHVISTETTNLIGLGKETWRMEQLAEAGVGKTERHRSIFRRSSGVEFKGYIHEELYRGEVNMQKEALLSPIGRYHFEGAGNHTLRGLRYCWMFKRAMENPELQRYTNQWWYDTYYPTNAGRILADAVIYEEYIAATGEK